METLLYLLYIFLPLSFIRASNTCTNLDYVKGIKGKTLLNKSLLNITTTGIMLCSRACLMRTICKSFNYNDDTGNCQLNNRTMISSSDLVDANNYVFSDISNWPSRLAGSCAEHSCPLNSYCDPVDDFLYSCVITGCLGLPSLDHGRFNTSPDYSPIGTNISLMCDEGYLSAGNLVCQENGTWSEARCVPMSSCSDVKRFQPDSEDGEYWIILTNVNNYKARIYCHDMMSLNPLEYVSLKNVNHGIYPQESNLRCSAVSSALACSRPGGGIAGGQIWFGKIRVTIETLQVEVQDLTFADLSNVADTLQYGTAHDCYTTHQGGTLRCGVKGEFTIDLTGTGMRISEEQEWAVYGYRPYMMPVRRERNGTLIYLKCGGYGGGCMPKDCLYLTPYPDDMDITK